MEDIRMAASYMPDTRRVFLADGNALVLSNRRLLPILDALQEAFPHLERVGIYGNAQDILRKSKEELRELLDRKLSIVYLGLESGNDKVLRRAKKGATVEEITPQEISLKSRTTSVSLSVPRDFPVLNLSKGSSAEPSRPRRARPGAGPPSRPADAE